MHPLASHRRLTLNWTIAGRATALVALFAAGAFACLAAWVWIISWAITWIAA